MRRSIYFVFVMGLILAAFSVVTLGQSAKAKKIDEYLSAFVKANQFGGQILAAENGKVIYEKSFGLANADFKIPNQLNTRIGIASITKSMTKVILVRMVESNQIALTDRLTKYIPDFPNGEKITIEMLARHRAGIPHRVMPSEQESIFYTSAEFMEKVKKAKLDFEPGEKNSYSSGGYAVLARALEIASGKSYAQLLQEYVFGPADMKDSLTFNGEAIMERRAQDYYPTPDGVINVPLKDYSFLVGAGSVYSTARDVYKFGEAVLDGKYGEGAKLSLIDKATLSSSGSTNGHRAYFEIENNKRYGYVIVANMSGAFDTISKGLAEILQDKELTAKFSPTPVIVANPNKNTSDFLGRYKRADGTEVQVVFRNDALYAGDIKLYPTKPDCFFEYRFFGDACFARNTAGQVSEIKWKGVGFDLLWTRQ